jgi:hypothetical protein
VRGSTFLNSLPFDPGGVSPGYGPAPGRSKNLQRSILRNSRINLSPDAQTLEPVCGSRWRSRRTLVGNWNDAENSNFKLFSEENI